MKRTIRFLGTGAGDFIKEDSPHNPPDYAQKVAKYVGKDLRRAASSLLGDDILIDLHSDIALRENHIDPAKIRHLLITHAHFDHFNPSAIVELSAQLEHPLNIYGSADIVRSMEFAATHKWDPDAKCIVKNDSPPQFNLTVIKPFESFSIGDTRITPVLANHSIQKRYMLSEDQALNFVFEYEGQTIFYGLDSSHFLPETMEFLTRFQFDICVLDGTFGYREIDPFVSGHLNFKMLIETRDAFRQAGMLKPNAKVCAGHISVEYAEIESHEVAAKTLEEKGIILTYDGLELEFPDNG